MIKHSLINRLNISERNINFSANGLEAYTQILNNLKNHIETKSLPEIDQHKLYSLIIIDNMMPHMSGIEVI